MSWGEVKKINSDLSKPLDKKIEVLGENQTVKNLYITIGNVDITRNNPNDFLCINLANRRFKLYGITIYGNIYAGSYTVSMPVSSRLHVTADNKTIIDKAIKVSNTNQMKYYITALNYKFWHYDSNGYSFPYFYKESSDNNNVHATLNNLYSPLYELNNNGGETRLVKSASYNTILMHMPDDSIYENINVYASFPNWQSSIGTGTEPIYFSVMYDVL